MLTGDPSSWLGYFRDIEQRFVERLEVVWPECAKSISSQTKEDDITMELVLALRRDRALREFGILDYQHALLDEDQIGDPVVKGFIDMALLMDDEVYVAFECKRLNMVWQSTKHSLAGKYVDEGIMRYITAQYARDLPLGVMIGYVMDGDLHSADRDVRKAMDTKKQKLCLSEKVEASSVSSILHRFRSLHARASNTFPFEVRHALLAV